MLLDRREHRRVNRLRVTWFETPSRLVITRNRRFSNDPEAVHPVLVAVLSVAPLDEAVTSRVLFSLVLGIGGSCL